ncbi:MAG: recombinase family protein [Sphingomonas sp.]|uniref:recombinase family protein n=1 Tax=Sphingomonas sp. TaxID=28214 RepID=UPI0022734762|nr:recombinase family protein [Sphingomonas sp.]MCX8475115.1 recombinase family protein [Sphingomonas sp.]
MTTKIYGYARVSTEDQDCSIQEKALYGAGCDIVRSEQKSGATTDGRRELETLLDFIRSGDTLMITRIDRLARSVADLEAIVGILKERGAFLRATEQPIDTSTPAGVAFLQMLAVFAQFETAIRRERQMEGIAKAKDAGVYKGRKPTVPVDEVRRLKAEGLRPADIARQLKIGRGSVYRALERAA